MCCGHLDKLGGNLLVTAKSWLSFATMKMANDSLIKSIFLSAVDAVRPENLIQNTVSISGRHLLIKSGTDIKTFPLKKRCYLVGFGKAVLGMALQLEKTLGSNLERAIISVPSGIFRNFPLNRDTTKIRFLEGAPGNIPDLNALRAAEEIKILTESLKSNEDTLIVLISGGGSSLFPLPKPPITLKEKCNLIESLGRAGANINELNSVRKELSLVKGGGLAELTYPATLISLILSDVVGDPLDVIASGPTVPKTKGNRNEAIDVIKKYSLWNELPESIRTVLETNQLDTDTNFKNVHNFIIGNNSLAAEAAKNRAISLGYSQTLVISTSITGNVTELSQFYAQLAKELCSNSNHHPNNTESIQLLLRRHNISVTSKVLSELSKWDLREAVCIVGAGEPTVVVHGRGLGGRNQQLALAVSLELDKFEETKSRHVVFLSAGTDGIDGPTDAAGAIGTGCLVKESRELEQSLDAEKFLEDNDSYGFYTKFRNGDYLVKTGHTGTNVMDIHILMVEPEM